MCDYTQAFAGAPYSYISAGVPINVYSTGPLPSSSPTGASSGVTDPKIITEDGEKFTYTNKFGGFWVSDHEDPYNNNARPNSWTPPLNQTWDFTKDRIYGPRLFEKYFPNAVDEWTLSEQMAADTASGGLNQLEDHYKTFIVCRLDSSLCEVHANTVPD
ncbi:hypothetical protein MPER_01333 [Moniliophthora perniciosa FA553]|nr:hypothetical protein MPER_01333 [Moniliophthora perniciosa FA553]